MSANLPQQPIQPSSALPQDDIPSPRPIHLDQSPSLPFDYYGDGPASIPQLDEDLPYIAPSASSTLLPPPNFQPFFTLIEDATTREYHHPTVHYVFSDDDPEAVTRASLAALESSMSASGVLGRGGEGEAEGDKGPAQQHGGLSSSSSGQLGRSARAAQRPKERCVLVTIAPDGRSVRAAHSLSPDWAVTSASVTRAPTFDGDAGAVGGDDDGGVAGLMLKVEGTEGRAGGAAGWKRAEELLEEARARAGGLVAGMEELFQEFGRGMQVLESLGGEIEREGVGKGVG